MTPFSPYSYNYFDSITSTHTYIKDNYSRLPPFQIIHAGYQTNGRGRLNRQWQAPKDSSLLISILLPAFAPIDQLACIGHTMAIAITSVLEYYSLTAKIRWPNDIIIANKKIAGLLTEAIFKKNTLYGCIVSIGLNCNQSLNELQTIDRPATSLHCEIKQLIDQSQLLERIIHEFHPLYERVIHMGFHSIISSYEKKMAYLNEEVLIDLSKRVMKGYPIGITMTGELRLKDKHNQQYTICTGELTRLHAVESTI